MSWRNDETAHLPACGQSFGGAKPRSTELLPRVESIQVLLRARYEYTANARNADAVLVDIRDEADDRGDIAQCNEERCATRHAAPRASVFVSRSLITVLS
jgi:hypothetical protein